MRRTYNSELLYYGDVFAGVNLGADYCTEHECGINDINIAFGIKADAIGIDRYTITNAPKESKAYVFTPILTTTKFSDRKMKWIGLYFNTEHYQKSDSKIKEYLPKPYKYTEDEICAAWDSKSFGIVVHNSKKWIIEELMNAIENKDLTIGVGPSGPFQNGGLKLLIASRIPQEVKDQILEDHIDYNNLRIAVANTEIENYLRDHGKHYYALEPRWYLPEFRPENREFNTAHNVVFFLNPHEQNKYNYGWFTVEELKEWGEDKGPVCKSA